MVKRSFENPNRCSRCRVYQRFCFCSHIVRFAHKSPVTILMHHREKFLTSNTAYFSKLCLENCEIIARGLPEGQENEQLLKRILKYPDHKPLYLFPDETAITLTHSKKHNLQQLLQADRFHLIVPDGSWTQARKMKRRVAVLNNLQSIALDFNKPSEYLARRQNMPSGLCTFEAIAQTLGFLEQASLQEGLETVLLQLSNSILKSRNLTREDVKIKQSKLWEDLAIERSKN